MKTNRLKQLWSQGKPGFGMWAALGSSVAVEAMGQLDPDWVLLDAEHGISSYEGVLPLMQALAGRSTTVLVRLPAGEYIPIKRVLDMGAEGIMVPQIRNAEEVREIVSLCRYAPEGTRGIGPYRASGYELDFPDYFKRANEQIVVIVQIEHPEAVANLEEILAVDGLDSVFIGPADLALSLGHFPQIDHPEVQKAITEIRDKARAAGKPVGYYTNSGEQAREFAEQGYQMVNVCNDLSVLARGLRRNYRQATGKADGGGERDFVTS